MLGIRYVVPDDDPGSGDKAPAPSLTDPKVDPGVPDDAWYKDIPVDQHTDFLKTAPDLNTFVKNANETKRMVGADTVRLPGPKSTPEERAEFFLKLGRPDEADKYSMSEDVKLPENVTLSDDHLKGAKEAMFNLGLTAEQGQGILDWYGGYINQTAESGVADLQAKQAEALTTLKNEWGDDFNARIDMGKSVLRQFDKDGSIATILDSTGLGSDPMIIKMFSQIGEKILDDSATGGGDHEFVGNSAAALAEISSLKQDQQFQKVLLDSQAPGHREAVERWGNLFSTAYPGVEEG